MRQPPRIAVVIRIFEPGVLLDGGRICQMDLGNWGDVVWK